MRDCTKILLFIVLALAGLSNPASGQVFFTEDFEGATDPGTLLPAGWTETGLSTDGIYKVGTDVDANSAGFWPVPAHSNFAQTNDDACGNDPVGCDKSEDRLILPPQDFFGMSFVQLHCDLYMDGVYSSAGNIEVSTDGGATWTSVFTMPASPGAWQDALSVGLDTYAGQSNVLIAFRFNDNGDWSSGLGVDNVSLEQTFAPVINAAIASVVYPSEYTVVPASQAPLAINLGGAVTNVGSGPVTNVTLTANVIDGAAATIYTTTSAPVAMINPGDTVNISLTGTTLTLPDAYSIEYYIDIAEVDIDLTNDTLYDFELLDDSTFGRDGLWLPNGGPYGIFGNAAFTNHSMATSFTLNTQDTMTTVMTGHANYDVGAKYVIYVYADNAGLPGAEIAKSDTTEFTAAPSGFIEDIYTTVLDPSGQYPVLAPGTYWVAINNIDNAFSIGQIIDQDVRYTSSACAFTDVGLALPWNYVDSIFIDPTFQFMIQANFGPAPYLCQTLTGTASATDEHCGQLDGTATAAPTSGSGPYEYLWATGDSTETVMGLPAGTYSVTFVDTNGCEGVASTTVNAVSGPTSTITPMAADTCGAASGELMASATGPSAISTYEWDASAGSQVTATAVGLAGGTYSVTVTDVFGCTSISAGTVNTLAPPSAAISTVQPDNCNAGVGSLSADPAGGAAPYTYLWSDNQSNQLAQGLSAGPFSVTITDAYGCTATASTSLPGIDPPTLTLAIDNDETCNQLNGGVTATPAGSVGPFDYAWSGSAQNAASVNDLAAGSVMVTVTDISSGCTATSSVTLSNIPGPSVSSSSTDVTICGASDGTVTAQGTGGTGNLNYVWNTPNNDMTLSVSNLAAGAYTVTVTDDNNCQATSTASVSSTGGPTAVINPSTDITDEICGNTNGSIMVQATGGSGSYTYLWNTPNSDTNPSVTGLAGGTYNVTVTDGACVSVASGTVGTISGPSVSITNFTNENCGNVDGTIQASGVDVSGSGSLSYLWDTPNSDVSAVVLGLPAGMYTVTVTDGNGCEAQAGATIFNLGAPTITNFSSSEEICGNENGQASVQASGGVPPLEFAWNTTIPQTQPTATGLAAGTYNVVITDANGCEVSQDVIVDEIAGPELAVTDNQNEICGNENGSVTVEATNGTPSYTYSWTGTPSPVTTDMAMDLAAGDYGVMVMDANGCMSTLDVTVEMTEGPSVMEVSVNDEACGQSNGDATVEAMGGDGVYTYLWSDSLGQTDAMASGLASGMYTVTVTDGNGCEADLMVTVGSVDGPSVSVTGEDALCNGSEDGMATATAMDGSGAYTYLWDGGQTDAMIDGLAPGTYMVTVTDENACEATADVTLSEPDSIVVTGSATGQNEGFTDGTASASAIGGDGNFTFEWNTTPPQMGSTATNLEAGTYMVTATDGNGCTATTEVTVDFIIGMGELKNSMNLTVYPNPGSGLFTIEMALPSVKDVQVNVYNKVGQVVNTFNQNSVQESSFTLDLKELSNGVYYLNIQAGELTKTQKVVIVH